MKQEDQLYKVLNKRAAITSMGQSKTILLIFKLFSQFSVLQECLEILCTEEINRRENSELSICETNRTRFVEKSLPFGIAQQVYNDRTNKAGLVCW